MPASKPEDMPRTFVSAFNSGDIDQLMELYEPDALLVPEPGQVASGVLAIRGALNAFLALNGKIEIVTKRVLHSGDLALLSTTYTIDGSGPDGSPVHLEGATTEVIRRQADGFWRYVIDDPFSQP